MIYILIKYLIGPIVLLLLWPKIYGLQNLNIRGKGILVCNHISMWDPVILAFISPRVIHFMAKSEIFKSTLGNLFFRAVFVLPVERKSADLQSIKSALKLLEKGKVFGIFPEGKRAVTDSLDEIEKGAALLAVKSEAPVIPIYIHPDSYRKFRPRISIGKPIDIQYIVANSQKSMLIDIVSDEIVDSINFLQAEMEERLCK